MRPLVTCRIMIRNRWYINNLLQLPSVLFHFDRNISTGHGWHNIEYLKFKFIDRQTLSKREISFDRQIKTFLGVVGLLSNEINEIIFTKLNYDSILRLIKIILNLIKICDTKNYCLPQGHTVSILYTNFGNYSQTKYDVCKTRMSCWILFLSFESANLKSWIWRATCDQHITLCFADGIEL